MRATHLVERALAALALGPQPRERRLGARGERHLPAVQLGRARAAVVADGLVCERAREGGGVSARPQRECERDRDGLGVPGLSGVLHPRQVTVLTANFMRPPTVGATIETVRVWSPATACEGESSRSARLADAARATRGSRTHEESSHARP